MILRTVEYSQIARKKLKELREYLRREYDEAVSRTIVKEITEKVRGLSRFPEKGVSISKLYDSIETDYYYLFINQNYIVYRFDDKQVIIIQIFNEKEDFMKTLFGVSGRTQESIDYWGE